MEQTAILQEFQEQEYLQLRPQVAVAEVHRLVAEVRLEVAGAQVAEEKET
jgi:hypothetical protein